MDTSKVTRVEVIDENGRSYVNWHEMNTVTLDLQDDGRTLKVFINKLSTDDAIHIVENKLNE